MSDPIKWSLLTSNQRNALVAYHIFHRTLVDLGLTGTLLLRSEKNPELNETMPAYIESMDEAWKVLQKLASNTSISVDFTDHLDFASNAAYNLIREIATWTPEKICIAALRATGLEIDTEVNA